MSYQSKSNGIILKSYFVSFHSNDGILNFYSLNVCIYNNILLLLCLLNYLYNYYIILLNSY